MTEQTFTEHPLIQINSSVVDPNGIAVSFHVEGRIGQQRYSSKPTGMVVQQNDYRDVDFANVFIAQQLPNASVHIKWLRLADAR